MRAALATAFLLALLNTGAVQEASSKFTATEDYAFCVRYFIEQLDDHQSDARTVAAAVFSSCRAQRVRFTAEKHLLSKADASRVVDELRESDIDAISAVVLTQRAATH